MHNNQRSTWSLWRIGVVLVLLGVGDLFLTWQLIDHQASAVVESNPLAALVLESAGWTGLAAFKFGLVGLFFGLTWIIERGRPTGGMLLLVFACGVHAAVVTSSVFMYLEKVRTDCQELKVPTEPYQPPQTLPVGALALVNQSAVQEELKLTAAHKQTIFELTQQRRSLSHQIKHAHLDACQSELENIASLEHHLMLNLSPVQAERLGQLVLQKRGPTAFLDGDVCNSLEFSEHQYAAIAALLAKLDARQASARARGIDTDSTGELTALSIDIRRQLLGLLTAEQKTRWNAMQGAPFDFALGRPVPLTAEASE